MNSYLSIPRCTNHFIPWELSHGIFLFASYTFCPILFHLIWFVFSFPFYLYSHDFQMEFQFFFTTKLLAGCFYQTNSSLIIIKFSNIGIDLQKHQLRYLFSFKQSSQKQNAQPLISTFAYRFWMVFWHTKNPPFRYVWLSGDDNRIK